MVESTAVVETVFDGSVVIGTVVESTTVEATVVVAACVVVDKTQSGGLVAPLVHGGATTHVFKFESNCQLLKQL